MHITVKELIEKLKKENPDKVLHFGGLDFYRLKDRGPYIQFEFNQTVYKDDKGIIIIEDN
jgi:hypothetical protein